MVDDTPAVRQRLREELEARPLAAQVSEADDGAVGLRMALEGEFDCVLCDWSMPRIDGIGFLRVVRAQRSRLALPVLLLTAEEAVADKVLAFRCGASDFITKPYEVAELLARVDTQVALARMHRQLAHIAEVDPLTHVWNRRKLMSTLKTEVSRAHRTRRQVSLVLIDVDFFKQVNDRYGHPVGDAVLTDLARLLAQDRRAYDGLGRMGGEEFAVVLPDVGLTDAVKVAERIRALVQGAALGGLEKGAVTVSLGVDHAPAGAEDCAEALYKRADRHLYEAKRLGRNRVFCSEATAAATLPAPDRSTSEAALRQK